MKNLKLSKKAYEALLKRFEKTDSPSFDTWGDDLHAEIYRALAGINLVSIAGSFYTCTYIPFKGRGCDAYPDIRRLDPVEYGEITAKDS